MVVLFCFLFVLYRVNKKSEQILNRSLLRDAPQCTMFFSEIGCLSTYDIEINNEKN